MPSRRFETPFDCSHLSGNEARAYCHAALPRVSRTFALNIRLLPGELGDAVTQAYLFCRMADTVEDSPHLDAARKLSFLEEYSKLFPLRSGWEKSVLAWARGFEGLDACGADHALCNRAVAVFKSFEMLPGAVREPVEECVREMSLGMRQFVQRRAASPAARLQLETLEELEQYCHYVAGSVGQMLCRLFAQFSPHVRGKRLEQMLDLAERFGLAMQLTNIIKDVADDADRGACYIPRTLAQKHGLRPEQIFDPVFRAAARNLVRELATYAAQALDAALRFTLLIPRREVRLRLFCLWPLFLAVRTLTLVLHDDTLFIAGSRPRIDRREVRRCMRQTALAVLSNRALRRLYAQDRAALEGHLPGAAAAASLEASVVHDARAPLASSAGFSD